MNLTPDPANGHSTEAADDRQIRDYLARAMPDVAPSGIEASVLRKVGRRRLIVHTARAAAAVVVLGTAGFLTRGSFLKAPGANAIALSEIRRSESAEEWGSLSSETAAFVSVSESAPVATLGVVVDDQFAMLECLKTFMEQ